MAGHKQIRHGLLAIAFFVGLYLMLDWASYVSPLRHLNLTPWNPAPALGLLYIIRRGSRAAIPLFLAIVASECLIRHAPVDGLSALLIGATLTMGYLFLARLLKQQFVDNGLFGNRAGLLRWTLLVVTGALVCAVLFVSALFALGLLSAQDWLAGVLRFWIGDAVGIFITFPLFWWLQDSQHRHRFLKALSSWETVAYLVLLLAALWVAFVLGAETHYRYFYVLFLPAVWAASRQGFAGAAFCVSVIQLGIVAVGALHQGEALSPFELQMRAFLLALVGFLIGVAVDEQRRAAAELRQSHRLLVAGEMAGALAHELNQPLAALAAYGAACEKLLERGDETATLRDTLRRMRAEATRAAEVVRRLRDFFRSGATRLETMTLADWVASTTAPFRDKAISQGVEFHIGQLPDVAVQADRLQLEVVLRNLLANAFEAVAEKGQGPRRVTLEARMENRHRLILAIRDNGPGLSPTVAEQVFEPFASTKSQGLGLGLAISRAITEAHGGQLLALAGEGGHFQLILPLQPASQTSHE